MQDLRRGLGRAARRRERGGGGRPDQGGRRRRGRRAGGRAARGLRRAHADAGADRRPLPCAPRRDRRSGDRGHPGIAALPAGAAQPGGRAPEGFHHDTRRGRRRPRPGFGGGARPDRGPAHLLRGQGAEPDRRPRRHAQADELRALRLRRLPRAGLGGGRRGRCGPQGGAGASAQGRPPDQDDGVGRRALADRPALDGSVLRRGDPGRRGGSRDAPHLRDGARAHGERGAPLCGARRPLHRARHPDRPPQRQTRPLRPGPSSCPRW